MKKKGSSIKNFLSINGLEKLNSKMCTSYNLLLAVSEIAPITIKLAALQKVSPHHTVPQFPILFLTVLKPLFARIFADNFYDRL